MLETNARTSEAPRSVGGGVVQAGLSDSPDPAPSSSAPAPRQSIDPRGAPSDVGGDGAWQGSPEDQGPVTAGDSRQEVAASEISDGLFFQVFSPEYNSELITTDLQAPSTASAVKALVAQLRSAEAHRRSPRLVPSQPQPAGAPGVLLALPHWPFDGVAVLIDCRLINGRIFALDVPGVMSKQDVLVVAGIELLPPRHFMSSMGICLGLCLKALSCTQMKPTSLLYVRCQTHRDTGIPLRSC